MAIMGPLQLSNHVVQNRHSEEQMTHWDMLKKAAKFEFSLFSMHQCVICSPVWRCLYHVTDCSAANGPLRTMLILFHIVMAFNDQPFLTLSFYRITTIKTSNNQRLEHFAR